MFTDQSSEILCGFINLRKKLNIVYSTINQDLILRFTAYRFSLIFMLKLTHFFIYVFYLYNNIRTI